MRVMKIGKEDHILSLLGNGLKLAKTDFYARIAHLYMFCLNAWPIDVVVNKQAREREKGLMASLNCSHPRRLYRAVQRAERCKLTDKTLHYFRK